MTLQNNPCNVRVSRSLEKITADCEMLRRNDLALSATANGIGRIGQALGPDDTAIAWHYRPYTAGDGFYCISVYDAENVLLGYL